MRTLISALIGLAVILSFVGSPKAHAFPSPVSLSILPPVQFPPEDFSITGIRMSVFYGHHRDVYGLDLGVLGNVTDQDFTGIAVSGLFNYTKGTAHIIGLQLAGATNIATEKTYVYGLQAALGLNYLSAQSSIYGVELALVNIAPNTTINGLQLGLYNRAQTVHGFQIGLINVTNSLSGLQIGLANFNHTGLFPISPFLNVGF
jgi:hypothetical protein